MKPINFPAGFLAVVIFLVGVASAASKDGPVDLALTDLSGQKVQLKDYRGKIVVLNFWATWCGPCREEMPMLTETAAAWRGKGVVFIGASVDALATRRSIPAFVDRYRIPFPVWVGATGDDVNRLGLGNAVPDTAFLNTEGVVVARIQGQMRKVELEERLAWLTGDQKGEPPAPLVRHF